MSHSRALEGQKVRSGNSGLSAPLWSPIVLFLACLLHTGSVAAINITMPSNPSKGSCINSTLEFNSFGRPAVTKNIDSIAPCDLTFVVLYDSDDIDDTNNSTSLNFLETVTNSSGITWHDYHFVLGSNFGDDFVPATTTIAPHFDGPDLGTLEVESTGGFDLASGQSGVGLLHSLDFVSNSGVLDEAVVTFDFNVFFRNCPQGTLECREEFTLRQEPTVPEPATLALLAIGLFGAAFARKRELKRGHTTF